MASSIFDTLGAEAASRWLSSLDLVGGHRWFVEIAILANGESRLDLNVYAEEWGFALHHAGKASWIRVTDVAFVHGQDDFQLLQRTPDLLAIHGLLGELEREHALELRFATASIRSSIADAPRVVRDWLVEPLPYSTVKRTAELCDATCDGVTCMLRLGHDGDHEHASGDGKRLRRWRT
jgi:hypothetical protein